jgi:hypothetical protein
MTQEIKPCPKCKESNAAVTTHWRKFLVRCLSSEYGFPCGAFGPWADTRIDAIELWNEGRTNEPLRW